jgi:hypothetical protein
MGGMVAKSEEGHEAGNGGYVEEEQGEQVFEEGGHEDENLPPISSFCFLSNFFFVCK